MASKYRTLTTNGTWAGITAKHLIGFLQGVPEDADVMVGEHGLIASWDDDDAES
jgi:hypothetical protein